MTIVPSAPETHAAAPAAPVQSQFAPISLPVGNEEGKVVFAHVRFDAALKKEWLASLRTLLEAMEKTLP